MSKKDRNVLQVERSFFGESLHLVGQYFKSRLLVSLIFAVVCWLVMWLFALGTTLHSAMHLLARPDEDDLT